MVKAGVPLENITMTSDACGSLPDFDEKGNLVKLEMGLPKSVFDEMIDAVTKENMKLEGALKVVTSNVADILKLKSKGRIAVGKDADLVFLDSENRIYHLIARGKIMTKNAKMLVKGSYE